MVLRLFLVCVFAVLLSGCVTRPAATVYTCEDAEYARHRLILHPNGRFVVNLVYYDKNGDVDGRAVYGGYYRKSFYAYDLEFDNLSRSEIKKVFKGTIGIFLQNANTYRFEKVTPNLFIGSCRMRREG